MLLVLVVVVVCVRARVCANTAAMYDIVGCLICT